MNDIRKLQEKVAYQEYTIEELNEALTQQQKQITHLQEELRLLKQIVKLWRDESRNAHIDTGVTDVVHEIPPHY